MPYIAIKGSFHVVNYSPDGDSIRFQANDIAMFTKLSGIVKLNARRHAQLRLEGIDTLETHYTPPDGGAVYHQPLALAQAAVQRLLDYTNIANVTWDASHKTIVAADDGTQGYILSRAADKYNRPIAFLFAGDPPVADGGEVFLAPGGLAASYNHVALAEGLAYPTFYQQLFADLRQELTNAMSAARSALLGLWGIDRTSAGFSADSLAAITDTHPIMPKLFRRLAEHMTTMGTAVGFKQVMEQSQEPVFDLRDGNFTHFDTFIEQAPGSLDIRLLRAPEELVFDPMPIRPVDHFERLLDRFAPQF